MTDDHIPEADKAFVELATAGYSVLLFRNSLGAVCAVALDGQENEIAMHAVDLMDPLDARITDHASASLAMSMLAAKLRDGGASWRALMEKLVPSYVTTRVDSVAGLAAQAKHDAIDRAVLSALSQAVEGSVE